MFCSAPKHTKLNLQTPLYCCYEEANNLWFMQRRQQESKVFSYSSNSSQSIRMSTVIDLVSHTSYVVCVNFIYNCWERTNDRFFEKLFRAVFIYSQEFVPEICWGEKKAEEIIFVFCFNVWPGARTPPLPFV